MTSKQTLIIDCDGVLYPTSQLSLRDFVNAMKETYRLDYQISGEIQKEVSEQTIAENKLGMFNYIKAVCDRTGIQFEDFCQKMFKRVDYDNIKQDKQLLNLLLDTAQKEEIIILTNNHISHLNKVLYQRFDRSISDFESAGIKCYDITATESHGVFMPKQNPEALELFISRINRNPENCILIDDSPRNIEAAKTAGMQSVLITEEKSLKSYLTTRNNPTLFQRFEKENA